MIRVVRLNYRHLRYFHAIAHAGGLTRAAEALRLSQSALSVQLGALEASLGHPLFERKAKRMVLTEAGRIALDYADTIFDAGDELVATLSGQPRADRRTLRVGALTTLSRNFQIRFLQPLVARDDVELVLKSGAQRELIGGLESHALDIVLATGDPGRAAAPDIDALLIEEQPVSIVGHQRAAPFRFPQDLDGAPMLLPGRDSDIRHAFDRVVDRAGVRPVVAAEVDDMAMLRLLARESPALALVPPIVVADELASGALVEHARVNGVAERFHALTLRRRFQNPLVHALLAIHAAP